MPAVLSASLSMQSLLSQSESNAFQSFLSSMDYPDTIPADEWAAFSASSASMDLTEDRQALTKATKDLMSLDTDANWDPNDTSLISRSPVIHPHFDDLEHRYQQESHGINSYSSRHDPFPFLHTKPQQHHPISLGSPDPQQRSPSSPHSSYNFPQGHIPQQQPQRGRGRDLATVTRPKRSHILPSTSPASTRPTSESPHKRQRLSPTECPPTSAPETTSAARQQPPSKPSLLSVSQKKANHIQSEQKRRANIRRGYAALCETVPALREAIREEEEEERMAAANPAGPGAEAKTNGAGKKRRSKKSAGIGARDLDDRDKIDGRAGPRSENMVLSKTIEHIQSLLTERSSLLARLQHARAVLPPGHPALTTLNPDPPWEREWKGGEGKLIFGDGGDGDEEGSGDEDEDG